MKTSQGRGKQMGNETERLGEEMKYVLEVEKDTTVQYCYLMKGGYYYRPGAKGYTEYREDAGIFTKKEALKHAYSCHGEVKPVPVKLEDHNRHIYERVAEISMEMKSLLLKVVTPDQVLKY